MHLLYEQFVFPQVSVLHDVRRVRFQNESCTGEGTLEQTGIVWNKRAIDRNVTVMVLRGTIFSKVRG